MATVLTAALPIHHLAGGGTTTTFAPHVGCDRPLLRGRLHQVCFLASIPAGVRLWDTAGSVTARLAVVAFAATWTAMFGTSAAYHRYTHRPATVRWARRADHSMIFVHMGGASTALALLTLPAHLCGLLVPLVWLGVGLGVVVKLACVSETCTGGSWLYPLVGGTKVLALPVMVPALSPSELCLLAAAVVLYGVGAALFFTKRLDLVPRVFGYHEVWHCFTAAAGTCQFLLVSELLAG